jgi:peptidyl-prolyl cis-trans isomerase C
MHRLHHSFVLKYRSTNGGSFEKIANHFKLDQYTMVKKCRLTCILLCGFLVLPGGDHTPHQAFADGERADGVLAAIGSDRITSRDLEHHLKNLPVALREQFSTPEGQQHLLKELVRIEIFSREGRAIGLDQTERFKARLDAIAKALLAEEYSRQEVLAGITVEEPEARRYYTEHATDFTEPERIKAPSIFINIPPGASALEIAAKEAQGRDIVARLRHGEDFGSVAERFSERSYQENPDYFARGRLVPEVEESVFGLQVGAVSPLLKVESGLLIFKLEDRIPARVLPYEQVRDEVYERLRAMKRKSGFDLAERRLFEKYQVAFAGRGSLSPPLPADAAKEEQVTKMIGRISAVTRADANSQGQGRIGKIMVEDSTQDATGYGRVTIAVSSGTEIFIQHGSDENPVAFDRLGVGEWVAVEAAGPVAASYPAQAEARKIVILQRSP